MAGSQLSRSATAVAAAQAVIAAWGASSVGIEWSRPTPRPAPSGAIVRRFAIGAGWGVLVATVAVAAALAVQTAAVVEGPRSLSVLLVGLAVAAFSAVRDELLLRGVVLRALRDLWPAWAGLLACAGAGAAARLGVDGHMTLAVGFDAARGAALGALWLRGRGAWMAVGANFAWIWTTDSWARGGVIDVRYLADAATDGPTLTVMILAAVGAAQGCASWAFGPPRVEVARQSRPNLR